MTNKMNKSIDTVKLLQKVIYAMEEKRENNPEYIILNIQLIDKITNILNKFKENMQNLLVKS